jgi:hypothetical protein
MCKTRPRFVRNAENAGRSGPCASGLDETGGGFRHFGRGHFAVEELDEAVFGQTR